MPPAGPEELLAALRASSEDGNVTMEDEASVRAILKAAAATAGAAVCSNLLVVLDYDLTMSAGTASECHHLLRDSPLMPAGFRKDVHTLFAARDEAHEKHHALYGNASDAERPHSFWRHYNEYLTAYPITQAMIEDAVVAEKARCGRLLREGVGELLAACDGAGVPVVILSAGIEQIIRAALKADGVRVPESCRVLANSLVFAPPPETDVATRGGGRCVRVAPSDPPASREGKLALLRSLPPDCVARPMVLMVGDKPIDAKVARGLPPSAGVPRTELSFGFFNERPEGDAAAPAALADWQAAFSLLARRGNECSFKPVTVLVRALLGV